MTNTPVTGSVPPQDDPVADAPHEATLQRALRDALEAKSDQNSRELEDMADGN
ncbi:MAG: hypothetical protein KKH51_10260 [Actinobacteria bacterium]|nr:hypothetical protein [Actinomycetota bacterium]